MNIVNSQIVAFPQIEQQNFENRVKEIVSKKKQKLWEIQARVDSAKREVHCAKVWAKILGDGNRQQLDSIHNTFLWAQLHALHELSKSKYELL